MKILTIGNSFTDSLAQYFSPVVESAGCQLLFQRANFGGCELERHWSYVQAEENSPICRIYCGGRKLRDILASEKWDVVTLQQASHASWRPETFQPFASNLAAYVKKHAPEAEVVVQQTWAYRADHPEFLPNSHWGINQAIMYERLTENYRKMAADLGHLRIIPTGYAVQLSRRQEKKPFQNYPVSLLETLRWPDLPPQAGDVVGQIFWSKNAEGRLELRRDLIHLNLRGQYMQACLWFAFLYGRPVSDVKFVPTEIDNEDAAFLRGVAQAAVKEF